MTYTLTTPREADILIARMFSMGKTCSVSVREDKAFKDGQWLGFGRLDLESGGTNSESLTAAVRRGAFEWSLPTLDQITKDLTDLLNLKNPEKDAPKLKRAMNAMAAISVRSGLQHPRFDPYALEAMPFRRSTTVVADTSGALQGGLDFVARYLHPAARVKVPAVVQMEIVNFAERFLSGRRSAKPRPSDLLSDHLMSQGGQRVLLRLELQADTEIERTFLLGDPLRNAFQADADPELKDLNLSVAIKAYADRLILEAARQHQAQANHGHRVQLLTSDQGLARMALAEGMLPLFFSAVTAEDLFGKRLQGAILDPFTGRLREMPLSSLVWELSTAFGSVRLQDADGTNELIISAIGEDLSWSPYQSHADLLWCDSTKVPDWPAELGASESKALEVKPSKPKAIKAGAAKASKVGAVSKTAGVPLQRFNVGQLLALIDEIDNDQRLSEAAAISTVGAKNRDGVEEYRRFLLSAGLIDIDGTDWVATADGQALAIALRNENVPEVTTLLQKAPSFALFLTSINALNIGEPWTPGAFSRPATTYKTLGELCRVCAPIADEGLFATPNTPDAASFVPIALERFRQLNKGDGLVATGAWLEALIRQDGIHPEIARERLNDASRANLLIRSTEGSTTETRFDRHSIQVLRIREGRPIVATVHLYRGDYLIPGKSSTSLHIEGPAA